MLAIGLLGSCQNVVACSVSRGAPALGVHLREVKTFNAGRVKDVLKAVEEEYANVGVSLLDVFFPGGLRLADQEELGFWRKAIDKRNEANSHGTKLHT